MGAATVRPEAGLVDLLDRVLDRGLVIHADIMITLAGIPLVGLSLKAQLAGMETMMANPQMREWDARIRSRATRQAEAVRAIQAAEPAVDVEPAEAIVA
jgi:Gas vesicle protein